MALTETEEFELLSLEREKALGSTPGGAATYVRPELRKAGERGYVPSVGGKDFGKIVGAGGSGVVLGAVAPEILTVLGAGAAAFPATAPAAPFLMGTGRLLRGQRMASALAGGVSGVTGEMAGQTAEALGAGPATAEAVRFVGGGVGPEALTFTKELVKKWLLTPSFTLASKMRKEMAKRVLGKIEQDPDSLTDSEKQWFNKLVETEQGIRGGGGRSDAELRQVGETLGEAADKGTVQAAQATSAAARQQSSVGRPTGFPEAEYADIGTTLRDTITARNKAGLTQKQAQYKTNEAARDALVQSQEGSGRFVNQTPEYTELLNSLKAQLAPGQRSSSVQAGISKILKDLEGEGPMTFQAVDDVRRKLGDAFSGKPAEGYDAIGETMAKDLYKKVRDIQVKFAGGPGGPQAKLLSDYEAAKEGLAQFGSKLGKKATALDLYDEAQFATDASTLPKAYFKTRASVQALRDLTGDLGMVNQAAAQYAEREIKDMTGPQIRNWLSKNSEWLSAVPSVQSLVSRYATKLEVAERATASAAAFAKDIARTSGMLKADRYPVERAANLIQNGTPELWAKAGPVIANSPQAKNNLIEAVRQTIANDVKPSNARTWLEHFDRRLVPALMESKLAKEGELDFIRRRLVEIERMQVPPLEKLGLGRRVLLQAIGGWSATAVGRSVPLAAEVPQ